MNEYTRRQLLKLSLAGAVSGPGLVRAVAEAADEDGPAVEAPSLPPPIATRMFWTWDHSTEWRLNAAGSQTLGASNYYSRRPEVFVEDYTRLLGWCGRNGIDAVVVWGLLRDTHGGLNSARRLCEVAAKEGVRILAGVGLNAYGGVYYEGNSPYSLEGHLEAHPDLYGINPAGRKMVHNFGVVGPKLSHHACPSRKENQQFAADSLRWLFESLPGLGGVQMETGDTGVCRCSLCEDRRRYPVSSFSWEDMALMYPMSAEAIRSVSPDAWMICETYSHPEPWPEPDKAPGFGQGKPAWADECLAEFPKNVFVQWTCDRFLRPKSDLTWTEEGKVSPDGRRHIMRAHFSTYWGRYRSELAVDWIANMFQRSMTAGFDTISLFGEVSPFHAGAELNYLALADFGSRDNPKADLDDFLDRVADPLLGGEGSGRDFLRYARLLENRDKIPTALAEISVRLPTLPPEAARRWIWLANFLASFAYGEA